MIAPALRYRRPPSPPDPFGDRAAGLLAAAALVVFLVALGLWLDSHGLI